MALVILLLPLMFQCQRKDEIFTTDPSAHLSFSEQVIVYDTLFADLTYPSHKIEVYNYNGGALAISEVSLAGGASSPFSILVNGQQGPVVRDLQLLGGDSMLLVISVFIDSTSQTTPYLVEDSIRFVVNGQEQYVVLKATGRNAQLIPAGDLACNTIWNATRPIVLLGQTVVPAGCSLTVQKGTQVFASKGSSLDIKGTLIVTGEKNDSVFFGGLFSGKNPGQWLGVRFYEGSTGNKLSWFSIENATTGMSFVSTSTPTTLADMTIDHGTFHDFTQSALDISYSNFTAVNCLFFASSDAALKLSKSGSASFQYCTWGSYSYDYYRTGPSIAVSNPSGSLSLQLKQSIVWGDKLTELTADAGAAVTADTCILKISGSIAGTGNLINKDPLFNSPVIRNYQLQSTSPAIDKCLPSTLVTDDLKGMLRDATPDIGCYEYKP